MSYYIRDVYDINHSTGEIRHHSRDEWDRKSKRTGVDYMFFILNWDEDGDFSLSKCEFYVLRRAAKEVIPWGGTNNGLTIHVTKNEYERWANESKSGYVKQSIKNSFMSLVEKNVFVRISRGYYMLNPYIYYKGNLTKITEARNRFEEIATQAQKDKHQSE